ncbi:MAG TPA: hypothetical protein VM513_32780 [Kofleriaceae bacterium]|nr:hypothetical protein [Kofleriaceae bacterium]
MSRMSPNLRAAFGAAARPTSVGLAPLLCVVAFACGGTSKPAPTALPPDQPTEPAQPTASTPAPEPTPPKEEPEPPLAPISETLEPQDVKVKLVSAGKGTKTKLAYAPKAGVKQPVELAIDFYGKQSAPPEMGGDEESGMPTLVLAGDADVKAADKTGSDYVFTVTSTDARAFPGREQVPLDKVKQLVATAQGLTITGKVAPTGTAVGASTLALEKPVRGSDDVVQLIQIASPRWPALPTEAIGTGAKWKATSSTKIMGKVVATTVTDYEVVSKKGTTWTIKGTTKLTGAEQEIDGAKFGAIKGTGTTEATIVEGALFPTFKTTLDASLEAKVQDKVIKFAMQIGSAVTASEAK